jgi:3-deoxy-D-manno-octulosonate 8-phosphate phosphatase (KDO 8-P phosphatase)
VSRQTTRLLTDWHWERLRAVRSLIFDVDGVLTDDTIWVGPQGLEFKQFHVSDGLAIALLRKRLRIKIAAVSGRHSEATVSRAGELGITPCLQGAQDKLAGVRRVLKAHRVKPEQAAFVGNEILDLPAFRAVGLKIAVADAAPELAAQADLVLKRGGGEGAAREVFELICHARGVDYVDWFA